MSARNRFSSRVSILLQMDFVDKMRILLGRKDSNYNQSHTTLTSLPCIFVDKRGVVARYHIIYYAGGLGSRLPLTRLSLPPLCPHSRPVNFNLRLVGKVPRGKDWPPHRTMPRLRWYFPNNLAPNTCFQHGTKCYFLTSRQSFESISSSFRRSLLMQERVC